MKERFTTLALALAALAFLYALLFPRPAPEHEIDRPLSSESRAHGYRALWSWLEAERIPVEALRQPYTHLGPRARGDVLIATVPAVIAPRRDELESLDAWVTRGNTLLVLAALDDTPPWALATDASFLTTLYRMTQLSFEALPERDDSAPRTFTPRTRGRTLLESLEHVGEPERIVIEPRGTSPLLAGVHSLIALSELPASHWRAKILDGSAVLEVAQRSLAPHATEAEPAMWIKAHGSGQIMVVGVASLFDNALIGERDNARLLANLIGVSRSSAGHVIFDDDHQGAVDYYDPKAFFHDPRLHRTILWIVLAWLLFVLGWQRLRPAADPWHPADITSFIGATGGFFANTLAPATVAARLLENFERTVRHRSGLCADGSSVWSWLEAHSQTRGPALEELKRLRAKLEAGRRVDLVRLQTLMSRILGALA